MNIKKILFPTDFSDSSEAALDYASTLAAESGAMLTIAHVANDTSAYIAGYGGFGYVPDLPNHVARENRRRLNQVEPPSPNVRHEYRYLTGIAEDEILSLAEREGVDLIVIGSHGRTGISRLLLGSVAEAVVRRAKCPVLTVKQPRSASQDTSAHPERAVAEDSGPISKHSLH
ncbi:MAG: universal stress protein [Planctomycetota bacterium]